MKSVAAFEHFGMHGGIGVNIDDGAIVMIGKKLDIGITVLADTGGPVGVKPCVLRYGRVG